MATKNTTFTLSENSQSTSVESKATVTGRTVYGHIVTAVETITQSAYVPPQPATLSVSAITEDPIEYNVTSAVFRVSWTNLTGTITITSTYGTPSQNSINASGDGYVDITVTGLLNNESMPRDIRLKADCGSLSGWDEIEQLGKPGLIWEPPTSVTAAAYNSVTPGGAVVVTHEFDAYRVPLSSITFTVDKPARLSSNITRSGYVASIPLIPNDNDDHGIDITVTIHGTSEAGEQLSCDLLISQAVGVSPELTLKNYNGQAYTSGNSSYEADDYELLASWVGVVDSTVGLSGYTGNIYDASEITGTAGHEYVICFSSNASSSQVTSYVKITGTTVYGQTISAQFSVIQEGVPEVTTAVTWVHKLEFVYTHPYRVVTTFRLVNIQTDAVYGQVTIDEDTWRTTVGDYASGSTTVNVPVTALTQNKLAAEYLSGDTFTDWYYAGLVRTTGKITTTTIVPGDQSNIQIIVQAFSSESNPPQFDFDVDFIALTADEEMERNTSGLTSYVVNVGSLSTTASTASSTAMDHLPYYSTRLGYKLRMKVNGGTDSFTDVIVMDEDLNQYSVTKSGNNYTIYLGEHIEDTNQKTFYWKFINDTPEPTLQTYPTSVVVGQISPDELEISVVYEKTHHIVISWDSAIMDSYSPVGDYFHLQSGGSISGRPSTYDVISNGATVLTNGTSGTLVFMRDFGYEIGESSHKEYSGNLTITAYNSDGDSTTKQIRFDP